MILKSNEWKPDLRDHGLLDKLSSLSESGTGEGIFVVEAELFFYSALVCIWCWSFILRRNVLLISRPNQPDLNNYGGNHCLEASGA